MKSTSGTKANLVSQYAVPVMTLLCNVLAFLLLQSFDDFKTSVSDIANTVSRLDVNQAAITERLYALDRRITLMEAGRGNSKPNF